MLRVVDARVEGGHLGVFAVRMGFQVGEEAVKCSRPRLGVQGGAPDQDIFDVEDARGDRGWKAEQAPRFGRRYERLGVVEGCALVVRELLEESDGRVVLLRQACAMAGQLRPLEIALGRV